MRTPREFALWSTAALCVLVLAPLACRRNEPPAPAAQAPPAAGQASAPAPDESVARREQAVAEREARVAEREAELARRQQAPATVAPEAKRAPGPQAPPTGAPEPAAAPTQQPAPAPREPVEVVVPAGTTLDIEFERPIASNTVAAGSVFGTRLTNDVLVGDVVAIPAGTEVHGTVTEAVPAKKIGGQARLTLAFDHLKLAAGATVPIAATFAFAAKSQTGKDAATIGGAAAGGAVLGNVLDRRNRTKGTVLGAILGGAIGTAIAANTPGEEVVIAAGSILKIRLTDQVRVTAAN